MSSGRQKCQQHTPAVTSGGGGPVEDRMLMRRSTGQKGFLPTAHTFLQPPHRGMCKPTAECTHTARHRLKGENTQTHIYSSYSSLGLTSKASQAEKRLSQSCWSEQREEPERLSELTFLPAPPTFFADNLFSSATSQGNVCSLRTAHNPLLAHSKNTQYF